jgi:hypothetical protein
MSFRITLLTSNGSNTPVTRVFLSIVDPCLFHQDTSDHNPPFFFFFWFFLYFEVVFLRDGATRREGAGHDDETVLGDSIDQAIHSKEACEQR